MDWGHTEVEKDDIKDLSETNPSLVRGLSKDYTKILLDDLKYKLNGAIPRNWVVNIRGGIGSQTGIFKTSMGLILALETDPTFNINERVAFTPNQLNDLIKADFEKYREKSKKKVFILDEHIHDLKQSALYRLMNIIESCRENQLCFILIGVPKEAITFSSYVLERFDETKDKYLPKKTVRYLVKNPLTDVYRGSIKIEIPQLKLKYWGKIWGEYMKLKQEHQNKVKTQTVSGFDFEKKAAEIIKTISDFETTSKKGDLKLHKQKLKNHIYKLYPDVTKEERDMIYSEVCFNYEK